ncbi:hypothetical protein [Polaromonas sp. C04]|uniref:hypothetical protein n=1 Tax=Polaromonas sp. C04 TaxID=1945857 RepID=UPI001C2B7DC3|nr:hypothetical protein [Polaromonas sp. C04]
MTRSKQDAVEQANILVTTTRGKGSLVEADWVRPGTHIVAIGTRMAVGGAEVLVRFASLRHG